jgi:decaprenylphospho-beta-D-ribofuranose 2-oxidase
MEKKIFCLGRNENAVSDLNEPDRYRDLYAQLKLNHLTLQGAGNSLCGASFSNKIPVINNKKFNRIIDFDEHNKIINVESGTSLLKIFDFLITKGYFLPVQPGYPNISVGGCIAANVHGKNPYRDGLFCDYVTELIIFNPDKGKIVLSNTLNKELFDLTCGAFGLTGYIISAKIKFIPINSLYSIFNYKKICNIEEIIDLLFSNAIKNEQCYAWFDFCNINNKKKFNGLLITSNQLSEKLDLNQIKKINYKRINPNYYFLINFYNFMSVKVINLVYYYFNLINRKDIKYLFNSLYPFAGKEHYFYLFGKKGFIEHQVIVPKNLFNSYFNSLIDIIKTNKLLCTLVALKPFKNKRHLLNFTGEGVSIAIHVLNNEKSVKCLQLIDMLAIKHNAIANIIKDSRISPDIIEQQYGSDYLLFKNLIKKYNNNLNITSLLAERLNLI